MRKPVYALALLTLLCWTVLYGGGCGPKRQPVTAAPTPTTEPPRPAPPPAPAPTITLTASPTTITSGQSSTLSWTSTNATTVTVDGGVGTVEPSGNRSVSPAASTTYNATVTGPGGRASASARVTVTGAPGVTPPPPKELTDEEIFNTHVKDIFFDYDRYDIRDDARRTLVDNARALTGRPGIRCTIEGHADERGSERYNLALGDKRANAAKEFLVSQGIAGDRLDTVSFGEERPFVQGQTEEVFAQNRRAHFVKR